MMNREAEAYQESLVDIFTQIRGEMPAIEKAAGVVADAIARGGIIHAIGPGGHSNMAVEEVLWRAGGLVPINAILDPGTNLIHGAKRSNYVERTPGYAQKVLDAYRVGRTPGEVIIIANGYGINAMCIDTAIEARRRGMVTIGVTSRDFADRLPQNHPSRHPSGRNLYQEVDHFLNCHLPYGDAVVEIEGCRQKTGPTATFCNIFTMNLLVMETVKNLAARGMEPPLWVSANLPGGDEANRANEEKYIPLIKHLG